MINDHREFVCEGCGQIITTQGHPVQGRLPDRPACKSGHTWSDVKRPRSAIAHLAVNVLRASRERWRLAATTVNNELLEIGNRIQATFNMQQRAA